jgi:dihydropyrimidinase
LVEQIFGDGMRKDLLEKNAHVDVALQACIFTDDHIGDIPQLVERGIVGFKFYLPYKGSEVVPPQVGIDDGIVYVGFEKIAQCGKPAHAQIHAENVEIFFKLKERFLKEEREVSWYDTRPNLCEIESILRCGYFAKITGCPVYVVHMSTKEGPEIVGRLRGEGVDIVAETCPQYLVCTKDNTHRILGKVNPPLRTKEDNESLWEGIRRGLVTTLGSDHAPCLKRHKAEFWSAVVGMAGVQTLLPVMLSEGVNKGRITLEKLVEIACYNNAKQFGLFPRKGAIRVGSDADLVIIDLKKTVKIEVEKLRQLSDFSPYEGWEITGWPVLTMVRGKIVMEDGQLTAEPGYGRFIPAERSS